MARGVCRNFPGWFSVTSLCDEGPGRHHRAGSRGRLDYLFTPHFGASLQMLKLEIGGGGFSSDGSEPSVEAVKGRLDCGAGYEFWLARQALARYPPGIRGGVSVRRLAHRALRGVPGGAVSRFRGYELMIRSNGAWQIVANGPVAVTLASGNVTAARAYVLSLTTRGATISAQINGVRVAAVTNHAYRYGPAGLGSLGYYPVHYPSFTVRSPSLARPRPGQDHVREF